MACAAFDREDRIGGLGRQLDEVRPFFGKGFDNNTVVVTWNRTLTISVCHRVNCAFKSPRVRKVLSRKNLDEYSRMNVLPCLWLFLDKPCRLPVPIRKDPEVRPDRDFR